ncbi:hypothetical protein [Alphaproteobacteria bacterium endosymbiont of Tiliacea citrago]|uniref:hypothetical protein n=1 Tax=Alphaproteobacteria bacterium endosymbiont of Tiliacea citrago TaxID=3077944 RepID=UPI00313D2A7C
MTKIFKKHSFIVLGTILKAIETPAPSLQATEYKVINYTEQEKYFLKIKKYSQYFSPLTTKSFCFFSILKDLDKIDLQEYKIKQEKFIYINRVIQTLTDKYMLNYYVQNDFNIILKELWDQDTSRTVDQITQILKTHNVLDNENNLNIEFLNTIYKDFLLTQIMIKKYLSVTKYGYLDYFYLNDLLSDFYNNQLLDQKLLKNFFKSNLNFFSSPEKLCSLSQKFPSKIKQNLENFMISKKDLIKQNELNKFPNFIKTKKEKF